jgi:hypothetical protein
MKKELIFAFSGLTLLLVGCSSSTDTGFKIYTKSTLNKYPATEEVMVEKNDDDANLKDTLKINGKEKNSTNYDTKDSYDHDFSYKFNKENKVQHIAITLIDKENDKNKTTKKVTIPPMTKKEIEMKKQYDEQVDSNREQFEKQVDYYLEESGLKSNMSAHYDWKNNIVVFKMNTVGDRKNKVDKENGKVIREKLNEQVEGFAKAYELKEAPIVELQDATGQTY